MRNAVEARGITRLFHFTRFDNLQSIFDNGLLLPSTIRQEALRCLINDNLRLDRRDALCLSVGFPNYRMLYKYRQENEGQIWAILSIAPEVLWTKACAFFPTNAAAAEVNQRPIEDFMGVEAFERMFDRQDLREARRLPAYYTTDPQAEVQILENIEPNLIRSVGFAIDADVELAIQTWGKGKPMKRNDAPAFRPRSDHQHWQ